MPTLDEAFDATFGATPAPAPLSEKPPRGLDEAFNATFGSGDTKLKATLTDAVRRDPVKTARAHELSKRTGLHPDAVVNSLMDVEMQQAVADADVLLQTDASMLKRFRDQPLFAAKAQKDLKALIELHGELKGFKGPEPTVMNIVRGLAAVPGQTVRTIKAGLGIEAADFLESLGATHPDEIDRKQRQREMTQAQNASSYTRPEFETTLGSGLYGIGETAIRMAPSLATLAITKSPTASLAVMGAQVQPESYLKYRERGATPGEATLGSTLETATELVTEIPTMNFMVKAFGKAGFGKFLSGVLGRETVTEEINTLITDAIDTAIANPNKTWEQYLAERPSRALETLITTVGYSGLLAGASSMARRFGDDQAAAQYAQEDADRLKNAFAATKLVQMREHAPADFGSAIQAIADEEDGTQKSVFIDADVFNQAIEKLPKDQLQKLQLGMPDVLAQVPNSLSTGASIEVPIGVLLATVTDTPLEDLFLQNSRANEHSLSLVEAKQAIEQAQSYRATEAEKVMQRAADTNATQVSAEAVKSNILGQLATANRFTADVNETQATLIRDFYTTLAKHHNITPEDAYARFPLQITAENVAGEVLNSGEDIGREMADRIAADPGAAVAEYNALEESNGGQILNTDIARELSPQYRADRTRSADVHEASSAFVKKMYADRLAAPTPEGKEPVVLFTAGGTGAGKSTGLAKVGGLASTAEIIFDTNMNTFESADLKIQQALKAGRKVSIVYTFRDPVEALTMGALPRATRMGRTVPLDAHEETHTGARLTMDQLAAKYAGNPDVEIIAIDNSKGRGNAEITALANIPQMGDNELKGKLHAALEEAYQTGAITEAIYRGTKGDVNTAGTVQPGSGETAGQQLEQQSATKGLTLEGYHFSKAPHPNLDTGHYGTGLQGSGRESYQNAEDKRLGQRLSFYVDTGKGIHPESGVGGIAHKVELTNIYDSNADPLRLRNGGQLAFESKVLDRGFSGYLDRMTGEQPGHVILLGPQSMKAEVLGPKSSIEGAKRVPAPLATPSQGRDIVADALRADKGLPSGAPTLARWQELLAKEPAILEALTAAGVFDGDLTQTAYRSELIKDFESKTEDPVYNQKAKVAGLAKIEKHLTPAERGKLRSDTAARFVDYFYSLPSADEFAAAAWAGRAKKGWYRESAQAIAQVFGADAPRFAALLAAMSPQNSVQTNLLNTLNTWKNWIEGGRPQTREEIVQIMGRSVEGTGGVNSVLDAWINNSVRALTTENPGQDFLSGPKVDSFMRNLLGNVDEVTNDAWMANFALVDQKMFKGGLSKSDAGKGPGYLAMSAKVRHAAKVLTEKTGEEWTPSEVQETIWSWAKTLYEAQTAESTASDVLYNEELTDDMIRATPDFKGLFHDAKYEKILRDAGYGKELDRLNPGAAGSQTTGDGSQAGPFDSATQSRHENNAARRLEILRRDGKPGADVFAQGANSVTVNIGLDIPGGGQLTVDEVNAALTAAGVQVQASTVRQSATEQTLVARLDRALTPDEANALSVALKQEAVAQRVGDVGELYGPKAELWKPFNPEYFLDLEAPLAQPARGTFNPRTLELSLLKDADLSTLSHELGHFFLEVMANVSTAANAPEAIVNDMATVLKWFGVKDIAAWNAMTLDQKRPYHEKFAESWEQYLFEGNAPTVELKPLFRRFREWMVNVYGSLEEFARTHNTQLNDEVRAVFGRMVAAEDQIKEAERTAGMLPDFNATNEAIEKLQARTLRDLKWTVNARSKTLKRLQADVADKRKAVKDEVTAEVREQPEYKVQRFLKFGELDGEKVTGGKLSLPVLKEMYGEGPAALWRYVATNMVTVDKTTGLHPNMVAELFGFPNGDAMTRAIVEAFPEDTEIEGKTDQRLLERYGDLVTDKGIERAANLAIHNEVRARFVASELKAMREGMNPRGKTANGGSVNVLIQAAKEFAQNLVSRRKINELKPGLHTAAEARAGRKADAAQSAGDTAGALTAKRDQLLSHYAAKYTYEAQDEVDKKLDYLRKFDKKSVRDKLPPDYMLQIDALLEQYDLRRGTTNKDITKRASLQAWVDAQLEMGLNPVVPQHILEDAALKSYKLLSVEEFRGLVDTVRNIEHLGRLKDKLLTLQDKRAFAAVVADVSNSILDNATKEHFDRVNAPTAADQAADLARDFFSSHRKISSLVRQMDGFTDNGVLWNVFSRTMNKAADTEASMREGATKRLAVIFKGLKGSMGELAQIPGIRNSLSLETRLAVALNWGNETNQQRVMSGDNWSQAQVDGILQSLTANQLHFVQNVWDFIDSYWPDIKAKEERVSGVAPEKVAAQPFVVQSADGNKVDMKGGYYPIKYDTDRSSKAEADDAAEITKQMMVGHYARATTRRGHTKARVDLVNRAVRKDINVIFQHVEQVAHDLAWHEWLIDATRLLRAKPIEQAIRNTVGPQVLREFTKAVTDIAAGDVPAQSGFERMINHVRQGATITGLGWNVMTSLLQPFGLTQSMVRIGPKWVGKGLARWVGGAARMEGTVKEIYAQSEFMRLRGETMNREMREILNKVRNKNKSTLEATYFYLIQKGQLIADVPTWLGQYEKAVAHGADETNAVAQADQAVRDAQGSGATSDLARIQRGGPLLKLFTNFYSFFNTTFNLTAESYGRTNFKNPLEAGRFAVDMLLLYTVPSVLVSLMKAALRGDDEDDDELAAKLAREQLNYLFGTMVGLREASAAISGFNGYQGPAGTRFFSEATKLAKQIEQGEVDEAALKALNNTAGTLLHYPAGAINRLVEGYLAYTSGESDNPLAPVVGLPVK